MTRYLPAALLCLAAALPASARDLVARTVNTPGSDTVVAQIWIDNWYALYVNGEKIAEDSTAYRTERSFNADQLTFQADLPATVAFELRDYMEDDTGLEYIGTRKQQIGDGGAIFQFLSSDGTVLGVSNDEWVCEVVHRAPVDTRCARDSKPTLGQGSCAAQISDAPSGWTTAGFNDSGWAEAQVYSERAVRPKDGYDQVRWARGSKLIWSGSLEQDNVVLCRGTIGG